MDDFIRGEINAEIVEDDDSSIYLSIADMMSSLLMFFALLFITILLQLAQKDAPKRVVIGNVVGQMKSNNINVKINPETGDVSIQESILFAISDPARQKLREWIGGINYGDFQKLVNLILNKLDLQDFESNRLCRRRDFWADYSNRFERLRILLPKTSQIAIGYQIQGDVDLLEDDGSDPTEVCIFDFGEWFVVEFFRGRGSETRLFPKNSRNEQILFGESTLSVKRIRCLGGDKHDHEFLWQIFSRIWLANNGILPNPNTQPSRNPTTSQLQDREYKRERWKTEIERLEREAKAYCM